MIKYYQEYHETGTGLGYQVSAYILMRSLANRTGFKWAIDKNSFRALRNTFTNLEFDEILDTPQDDELEDVEFIDDDSFEEVLKLVKDDSILHGYPTPQNFIDKTQFEELKDKLTFRPEVVEKCEQFMSQFNGQEVISMHLRRGDFENLASGMFLIGDEYYQEALKKLPEDLPVLIFTNAKDYVLENTELVASNPERFTLVLDVYNNNELVNCDVGQQLDYLVDISGECVFDYKAALAKMAKEQSPYCPTHDELLSKMKELAKELHPIYREKMKKQLYNYSFDFCLMSMCNYHIMANSTFGMWATELSATKKVIYPKYWMHGHDQDVILPMLESQTVPVKNRDLGGHDQTKELAGYMIDRENYIGIENPDQRSFSIKIVS
jgi:hypothetical protein